MCETSYQLILFMCVRVTESNSVIIKYMYLCFVFYLLYFFLQVIVRSHRQPHTVVHALLGSQAIAVNK